MNNTICGMIKLIVFKDLYKYTCAPPMKKLHGTVWSITYLLWARHKIMPFLDTILYVCSFCITKWTIYISHGMHNVQSSSFTVRVS